MDSIKNQFHSCYRNEQSKGEKAIQQLLEGGGLQGRKETCSKRNTHFALVQWKVPLEKFWSLMWIRMCWGTIPTSVLVLGNPGSARSWVQTFLLVLSQTIPQGSRSLFECLRTRVMSTHVCSHVYKCVQMYMCVSFLLPLRWLGRIESVGYLNSLKTSCNLKTLPKAMVKTISKPISLTPVKKNLVFNLAEVSALAIKSVNLCRLVPLLRVLKLLQHLVSLALPWISPKHLPSWLETVYAEAG